MVVGLRQPPAVVVAEEGALLVTGADADLDVQRAGGRVPHLREPVEAVARLGHERLGGATAELAGAGEQQHVVVRRRVRELQVVAGVEPAARDVDGTARPGEVGVEDQVAARLHAWPLVDVGTVVEQVRGLAVQRSGDDQLAVALDLVEEHAVAEPRAEEGNGAQHAEPRGGGPDGAGHHDPVATGGPQPVEAEPVDGGVVGVPPTDGSCRHGAAEPGVTLGVHDAEPCAPGQAGWSSAGRAWAHPGGSPAG